VAKNFTIPKNKTPQSEKIDNIQVVNSCGCYVYSVNSMDKLHRFLVLGSTEATYYASSSSQIKYNKESVLDSLNEHGINAVDEIISYSVEGRIPKNDTAIFALAVAASHSDISVRQYALDNLSKVCRIGTHLFTFLTYVKNLRGFGRSLKKAVANWYLSMPVDKLAMQICKYQSRRVEGCLPWSHRDSLRVSHPKTDDDLRNKIFKYITHNDDISVDDYIEGLQYIYYHEKLKNCTDVNFVIRAINFGISRESIPTNLLNDVKVWQAMLDKGMPITAMIRNLGKMTSINVLQPLNKYTKIVTKALHDKKKLKGIHPLTLLVALLTYKTGHGVKGDLCWKPITEILNALDTAVYESFNNVAPTNKNFLLAIDVSGSMGWEHIAGCEAMTPRDGAAALALTIARTEPHYMTFAFANKFIEFNIDKNATFESVIKTTGNMHMSSTDCSIPIEYAIEHKLDVDAFVILTDSETNHWTSRHPMEALRDYRAEMNKPNSKLVVVAMENNPFTLADPNDKNCLDVVGFDTNFHNVLSDFVLDKF
jgi:60 kDa SS-A/Ro ribonucleoprotein